MQRRAAWGTRFGFYLLAVGSAFGLGNLWRFPYIVGENGGGAFILLYVLLAFLIGAPLLVAELIAGQVTNKSSVSALMLLPKQPWKNKKLEHNSKRMNRFSQFGKYIGIMTIFTSIIVLSYYSVISGWVLHFIFQSVLESLEFIHSQNLSSANIQELKIHGMSQWLLASAHILITITIITKKIQEGFERWLRFIMPVFAVIVVYLLYQTIELTDMGRGVRFLFYPDFSMLNERSLIHAIGQVMFTLSVGFGTMITYGSYMQKEEHVPTAGFRVAIIDTVISLIAVLLLFPLAMEILHAPVTDPSLMFEVIPQFLSTFKGGMFLSILFFSSLYFAALNASVGLFEAIVANLSELFKDFNRMQAAWGAGFIILTVSLLPSLGAQFFSEVFNFPISAIEVMDSFLVHLLLPLVNLGFIFVFIFSFDKNQLKTLFTKKNQIVSEAIFPYWYFSIKWLTPILIVLGLLAVL